MNWKQNCPLTKLVPNNLLLDVLINLRVLSISGPKVAKLECKFDLVIAYRTPSPPMSPPDTTLKIANKFSKLIKKIKKHSQMIFKNYGTTIAQILDP